jgi:hypothetical protein
MTVHGTTLSAPVKDDTGRLYPDAFVGIRHASETLQKTLSRPSFSGPNTTSVEYNINALVYSVSYWCNKETFEWLDGHHSKPLSNPLSVESDIFEADVNTSESIAAMNSGLSGDDLTVELIRLDLIRRSS